MTSETETAVCSSQARKFCFQSPAWAQCISKCVEFSRVFRQVDNLFVELLEAIRQGKATIQQMSLLMDRLLSTTRFPKHLRNVDTLYKELSIYRILQLNCAVWTL